MRMATIGHFSVYLELLRQHNCHAISMTLMVLPYREETLIMPQHVYHPSLMTLSTRNTILPWIGLNPQG